MEGVKRLGEVVLVNLVHASSPEEFLPSFLQSLTQGRINMVLSVVNAMEEGMLFTCCVNSSDGSRVRELADNVAGLRGCAEFHHPVDLVSIFPHQFNLKAVGLGLMAFAKAEIPLYGLCSSLSALTFITGDTHSDEALAILKEFFRLPVDQSGGPG